MFFPVKSEETAALKAYRKTCTYHGLTIKVSVRALAALKRVIEAKINEDKEGIDDRDLYTLSRRGFIRTTNTGEVVVTETGLCVASLAEAGHLLKIDESTKKVKA